MEKTFTIGFMVAVAGIIFAAITGWVLNVVKIFNMIGASFNEVGAELVLRVLGVPFFPLGVVMGYL
jgi:maltodextrin utilization protein YvdJ